MNILRLDWNPVLPITAIFFGLLSVLLLPEGQEPLNQSKLLFGRDQILQYLGAGEMILEDRFEYDRVAKYCASGNEFEGIIYDRLLN